MRFTVAVCTWNRAALLPAFLDRLARVRYAPGDWEVVVVNNNSTDDTERVLDAFAGRLPLRRAFEPKQGTSHARNNAVREAEGDYVVWTDDDVLVEAGWLAAYARAAERHPEAAVFGGPVRPRFEGTTPPWLSAAWQDVGAAFAARDLGGEPFELDEKGELPYGANFVVRAREQMADARRYKAAAQILREWFSGGRAGLRASPILCACHTHRPRSSTSCCSTRSCGSTCSSSDPKCSA